MYTRNQPFFVFLCVGRQDFVTQINTHDKNKNDKNEQNIWMNFFLQKAHEWTSNMQQAFTKNKSSTCLTLVIG